MMKKKNKSRIILIASIFFVYFFIAARPVPREIILTPKWINSLDTDSPIYINAGAASGAQNAAALAGNYLFPFTLGYHFGYISADGNFSINRIKTGEIYLSDNMWAEFEPEPAAIEIKNIQDQTILNIDNPRGYPVLLDNRVFILGSEQNSLSEADRNGNIMWTYEFGSILTDIDVASGLVVAVSVDGIVEILDREGKRAYFFQPGGSRIETIYGVASSRDSSRIGIICGYDPQRFLYLEKFNEEDSEYRIVFHEYLDNGFRRPVRILFIDDDKRVVYERQGGINCYNIRSRKNHFIPLDGEVAAIENSGDSGMLFLITGRSRSINKELVGIKLPEDRMITNARNAVFLKAGFKSEDIYLGRKKTPSGSILIAGGGSSLISFNLEER